LPTETENLKIILKKKVSSTNTVGGITFNIYLRYYKLKVVHILI